MHIYYVKKFFQINSISVFLKKSIKGSFGPSYNLYIFKKRKKKTWDLLLRKTCSHTKFVSTY